MVFRHPGYSDFLNQNELLQLFGTDNAKGGFITTPPRSHAELSPETPGMAI